MPSRRFNSATILIAVIVGLLTCAVVVAELPELLTLTDCTANDFAVRKTSASHTITKPSAARYDPIQPNTNRPKYGEQAGWNSIFEGVKPTATSLFILLCTLRT